LPKDFLYLKDDHVF